MVKDKLDVYRVIAEDAVNEAYSSILNRCNNPTIADFVDQLLDESNPISSILREFVYEIGWSIDITSADALQVIDSFISNVFLDDTYFIISIGEYGHYHAEQSDFGSQDPKVLIETARVQLKLYDGIENKLSEMKSKLN